MHARRIRRAQFAAAVALCCMTMRALRVAELTTCNIERLKIYLVTPPSASLAEAALRQAALRQAAGCSQRCARELPARRSSPIPYTNHIHVNDVHCKCYTSLKLT